MRHTAGIVVRDIGTALGETGRLNPTRNDPALFEREPVHHGVKNGAVEFNYHGRHQELADHISPDGRAMDVRPARRGCSIEQWRDAFRAAATTSRPPIDSSPGSTRRSPKAWPSLRMAWMVLALFAGTHPCLAQPSPVIDPKPVATDHQMLHKYVWSTLGVEGAFNATVGGAIDQWRNSPPEWGTGPEGLRETLGVGLRGIRHWRRGEVRGGPRLPPGSVVHAVRMLRTRPPSSTRGQLPLHGPQTRRHQGSVRGIAGWPSDWPRRIVRHVVSGPIGHT